MTTDLTLEERLQIQLVTLERRADKYAQRGESDYPRLLSLQKRIRDLRTLLMNHRDEEVTRPMMATPIDGLVRSHRPQKAEIQRPHPYISLHERVSQVLGDTAERISAALVKMVARRFEGEDPLKAADMLARLDLVTGLLRTAGQDVVPNDVAVGKARQWVDKQLSIRRGKVYITGQGWVSPVPSVVAEAEPAGDTVVEQVRRVDTLAMLREELANHQRAASLTRPSAPLSYLVSLSARLNELGHIVARFDNKEWQHDTTFDHRIRTLEDKYEQMDAAVKNLVSLEEQDRFVAESMLSDPERFETWHIARVEARLTLIDSVLTNMTTRQTRDNPLSKLLNIRSHEDRTLKRKMEPRVVPSTQDGPVPQKLTHRINVLMREIETTSVEYRHLLEPRLVELLTLREAINDRGPPELDVEEKGLATHVSDELVAVINQRTVHDSARELSAEFRKSVRRVVNELMAEESRPGGLMEGKRR